MPIEIDPAAVTLLGVGAIPLAVLLVQAAKIFGLRSSWAMPAAMLCGFAVEGMALLWALVPESHIPIIFIVVGLQIGLGAAGAYSQLNHHALTKAVDKAEATGAPANAAVVPGPGPGPTAMVVATDQPEGTEALSEAGFEAQRWARASEEVAAARDAQLAAIEALREPQPPSRKKKEGPVAVGGAIGGIPIEIDESLPDGVIKVVSPKREGVKNGQ